jgi:enoyl-CoA hydratase/carnithine racemase
MNMAYEHILYDKDSPVVIITLNRPDVLNALSPALELELHAALDEADADSEARAIILTGAGRAFSAGYDMALSPERPQSTLDPAGQTVGDYLKSWWDNDTKTVDKLMHIWHIGTPVIAAVNGWTMGGGFWYAMACDITIASDQAVFAQPEVRHISNTTFLFAALAGWKAAHRYALTGDHMDAQEALRLGIVNEVVSPDQLLSTARALAERIAQVPEPSVRLNKAITCYGLEAAGLRSGMLLNGALSALAHTSHQPVRDDLFAAMREGGMRAFLDKRDTPFRPEPFGPRSTGR